MKKTILYFTLLIHFLTFGQDYDSMYELNGEDNSLFGYSVSMSENGQRIAIGSPLSDNNGKDSGKVEIFEFNGTDWIQIGNDIIGDEEGDRLGYNLEISSSGNKLIIGAPNSNEISGKVKLFEFNGANWIENQTLQFDEREFGLDVTFSHNEERIAISSHIDTKVYQIDEINNKLISLKGLNYGSRSVALSHNGEILAESGQVFYSYEGPLLSRMYSFNGNTWNQLGDHSSVFNYNAGCNGGCPFNFNGRIDISDTNSVKVLSSQRYDNEIYLKILEYNTNSNSWDRIGLIEETYYSFMGMPVSGATQMETSFMLSSSGDYVLIVNTGRGENRTSRLNIYNKNNNYLKIHDIVLPQLFFDRHAEPIYYFGFKGLAFSEDSKTIAVGLPTYNSVRIYNVNTVLSLEDNSQSILKFYPNPVKDKIFLKDNYINELEFIKFYSTNMQLIKNFTKFENNYLDISNLNSGVYFMSIKLKGKGRTIKKIIRE